MARKLVPVLLAASALAFGLLLPGAQAFAIPPRCVDTGPNTTQCSTNGSTASNRFNNFGFGPWFGWGGGLVIGIG